MMETRPIPKEVLSKIVKRDKETPTEFIGGNHKLPDSRTDVSVLERFP